MPAGALALDPDAAFRDARNRFQLVLRINIGISVALAVVLIGGIVGAIISALVGRSGLAGAFGGVTIIDLAGAIIYKPLKATNEALISTQRLDIIHLSTRESLLACAHLTTASARVKCAAPVWNKSSRIWQPWHRASR